MTTLRRILKTGLQSLENTKQFRFELMPRCRVVGVNYVLFEIADTLKQSLTSCAMWHTKDSPRRKDESTSIVLVQML